MKFFHGRIVWQHWEATPLENSQRLSNLGLFVLSVTSKLYLRTCQYIHGRNGSLFGNLKVHPKEDIPHWERHTTYHRGTTIGMCVCVLWTPEGWTWTPRSDLQDSGTTVPQSPTCVYQPYAMDSFVPVTPMGIVPCVWFLYPPAATIIAWIVGTIQFVSAENHQDESTIPCRP